MKTAKRLLSLLLCLCMLIPLGVTFASADGTKAENVAKGKLVEVSSGSNADAITDGSLSSHWDSTGADHKSGDPSTAIIDLQAWYDLEEITVVTYSDGTRYYHFEVAVSSNGLDYESIGKRDSTTPVTEAGDTFAVERETPVRYIRVTMTKNSANPEYHIREVMAMGVINEEYEEPVITVDPNDPDNVAVGKPTRANYNNSISNRVTDSNTQSAWSGNAYPQYVDVDLMANYDISEIIVYMPTSDTYTYTIYGSLDGVSFTRIAESNVKKASDVNGDTYTFEEALNYRVIRVNVTSARRGGKAAVSEIKVHGVVNNTAVTPTRDSITFTTYDEWLFKNHGVNTKDLMDENGNYDIADTYNENDTIAALRGLVSRILGDKYNDWFEFDVTPNIKSTKDFYEISQSGSKIKIVGNDGVAIASGLNYYLKYFCNVHVSQQTKQVNMPATAPKVTSTLRKETASKVRYAYNYCTLSYTMQFYGFDEWQRELDYLMLSGVNVILDTTGSEALWVAYLQQYGYTAQEAIDFVCGYAFKAWWLMGNLENYGGSVGDQWMYDTLEMARVNQRYMTVMGCMPCLNIFPGTMPINFAEQAGDVLAEMGYPNVGDYMTSTGGWCGFTRPFALNTTFPGFEQMSIDFYETQNSLYGQITDYYAGDFLHEITAGFQLDPAFNKANMSRTVLDYLLDENEDACWIMQSWWENPLPEVVEGFGDDREDHVLMLDLAAANDPRWKNTTRHGGPEFGNSGWVYCMLDNYGGRTGMHSAFAHILKGIIDVHQNAKHFKGMGITPEGTEENPVSYDFFWELVWFDLSDIPANTPVSKFVSDYVTEWVKNYAIRRYGSDSKNIQEAWTLLAESVYGTKTVDGTSTNDIITCEPRIFESGTSGAIAFGVAQNGGYYRVPYDEKKLEKALQCMIREFNNLKGEETYIYDICDMMCQVLSNSSTIFFYKMGVAINEGNAEDFASYKSGFLRCIELIDEVASYVDDTMLGNWVGRIDDWVADERTGDYADYDIDTMKYNALILPTIWSSNASLVGYANREYAGLMKEYYYKMWNDFLTKTEAFVASGLKRSAETNRNYDFQVALDLIVTRGENLNREVYDPSGDASKGVRALNGIYAEIATGLLSASKPVANKIVVSNSASGYYVNRTYLQGVKAGTTVSDLIKSLKGEQGGTFKVLDETDKEMAANAYVYSQCKVVLYSATTGAEQHRLTINGVTDGKPGIYLNTENLYNEAVGGNAVAVGATVQLNAYYRGTSTDDVQKIEFTTADPKIATVDKDGKITGVAVGETMITLKVGEHERSIYITVVEAEKTETPTVDEPEESGNMTMIVIIIAVVAVVVVVGGVLVVLLAKKKKK